MAKRSLKRINKLQFWTRKEGIMSVEMVILFPFLALLVVGLTEIGFLWFVRHTLTNASREGARAAVVYVVTDRENFAKNQAKAAVDTYLNGINFHFFNKWDVNTNLHESATGWTTGQPVTVTVTTPNGLLLLDDFIPAFNGISVLGVTTMKLE